MSTLRVLTVGMFFAAATAVGVAAAQDQTIDTITVTAKRYTTGPTVEHMPPQAGVAITVIMPTDMPEAEIDFHLSPIGAVPPAPTVE